jgi:ATP-dependent Lhr-like helicase
VNIDGFSRPTREWFTGTFAAPTPAQEQGWPAIAGGAHTLISAPTGSGKTLAAFMWAIDRIATEAVPAKKERCRVLYISPLRALAVDVEKNLRAPLHGIKLADLRRLRRDPDGRHAGDAAACASSRSAGHPDHDT